MDAQADTRSSSESGGGTAKAYRFPTTAPQRQICFLHRMFPESAAYHIPALFRIRGELDVEALKRAVREIVRRHEVLRTTFHWDEGTPYQLVRSEVHLEIPTRDLRDLDRDAARARARERFDEIAGRPFDLGDGPLLRAEILELSDREHLFTVTIHHVLVDHLSVEAFGRELETLYEAYAEGRESPLSEPELQYPDYAVWHRERLESEAVRNQLREWTEQLSGRTEPLDLPADRPRPAVQSFEGGVHDVELPTGLSEDVRTFGRGEGVSPFITLLTAFKVLLHRRAGADTVSVGTPFANRLRPELEEVMGCFINTLPLATDLSGDPTFRETLGRVRGVALDAQGRQETPFEHIVEELHPERDRSHNPLFQVSFTFQAPPLRLDLPGLEVESRRSHNGSSKFDLTVWLWEEGERIEGFIEYDSVLFDRETVARMADSYQALLEGAVAGPDRAISELPLLGDERRARIVEEWNDTRRDHPEGSCLHERVRAQARRTPDAPAIEFEGRTLTYRDLIGRSDAVARRLRDRGLEAGEPVALLIRRSADMVAGILGVLEAGGFYVPLDPTHPARRLEMILDESAPRVLLTEEGLVDDLPDHDAEVILLDEGVADGEEGADDGEGPARGTGHAAGGGAPGPPGADVDPDDLAYVIYTSGSTGRPKGVEIRHRSAVNFLAAMAREPGMDADDRILAVTTLSFDISLLELLLPLTVGATAVVVDSETASDGHRLREALRESDISILQSTPASWRLLLASGWEGDEELTALSGGETLPPDLAEDLLERTGELWNLYGPTETTVWSTRHRVDEVDGSVSIGRPIGNTRVHVLDENRRPVPVGVPGQLYIGGAGVARGYHRRPDLTEEKFIPDPFDGMPGDRLYATGDVARYRPGGRLEFLGRRDDQVKIRGFRIELGEVESALLEHPAVREATASVHERAAGDRRLVGYLVYERDAYSTVSEMRKHARRYLPDYMVPRHFVDLDELPLTPSGKVDRNALPDPFRGSRGGEDHRPPETEMGHTIAEIWSDVLGRDAIGVHDNFFDLGGHSLLVMKAIDRIEGRTGVELPPRVMGFETLGQIATRCREATNGGPDPGAADASGAR